MKGHNEGGRGFGTEPAYLMWSRRRIQHQSDSSWALMQCQPGTVPSHWAALLLWYPLGASDAQMHLLCKSAKVILDTDLLCSSLSSTRRFCGLLPTSGAAGLVPPLLFLQAMQKHMAARQQSLFCSPASMLPLLSYAFLIEVME